MTGPPPDDPVTAAAELRLIRDLLVAWALDRAGLSLGVLAAALLQRDIAAVMAQLGLERSQNALAALKIRLDTQRDIGWHDVLAELPKAVRDDPALQLSLAAASVPDPAILRLVQALDLSRITAITEETRAALSAVIAAGLNAGTHPNVLARELRDLLGVNGPQAAALAKYRARLIADGRKPDQIERMIARKAQVYRNQRARTIARTELARAEQEGARLQYQRLVDEGIITASDWVVRFQTREDELVCPICGPLDGQQVAIGGLFVTTIGMIDGPPLHTNCRCDTRLIPKDRTAPVFAALRGSQSTS